MEADALRRLHYAAAIACGVFAALSVHIALTVFGAGLDAVLRDAVAGHRQQVASALAWWAIAGAGFIGGWATGADVGTVRGGSGGRKCQTLKYFASG